MIFALGFLFSGLLTLLFLPAFWRRAVRLSTRRIEMQMPLTMTEIVAERDQLRAEFATEHRRLERRTEELSEARARDLGELGRRSIQIAALDAELADTKREALELRERISEGERSIRELEGAMSAANVGLHGAQALVDRRMADFATLEQDYDALVQVADERRAVIAALETRVSGLELRLMDSERDIARLTSQLADRSSALELAERERDFALHDITLGSQKREALQARIDELTAQKEELDDTLRSVQRARTKLLQHAGDIERDLAEAAAREAELRAALDQQARQAGEIERGYAERLDLLRGELGMAQGALAALRQDQAAHGARIEPARPASPGDGRDVELLRQAIVDVGAEVARLAAALEHESPGGPSGSPADRMRELQSRASRTAV